MTSPSKPSSSSDVHYSSKPSIPNQDPPAQPRRPAPTPPSEKDKEKKKESTKRRQAPAAPVSTAKQNTESRGWLTLRKAFIQSMYYVSIKVPSHDKLKFAKSSWYV